VDPCIVLQEGPNQKSNRKRDSTPTVPAPQHSSINIVTASWRLMATTRPGRTRRQQALFSVLDSIVLKVMKKLSRPGRPRLRHLVIRWVNHVVECFLWSKSPMASTAWSALASVDMPQKSPPYTRSLCSPSIVDDPISQLIRIFLCALNTFAFQVLSQVVRFGLLMIAL
jgi:hypothetical protein